MDTSKTTIINEDIPYPASIIDYFSCWGSENASIQNAIATIVIS